MAEENKLYDASSHDVCDISPYQKRTMLCRFLPAIIELEAACRSYDMPDVAVPLSEALDRMETYLNEN